MRICVYLQLFINIVLYIEPPPAPVCVKGDKTYELGEKIDTGNNCEHCECLKGGVACAIEKCSDLASRPGLKCVEQPVNGQCCPRLECTEGKALL